MSLVKKIWNSASTILWVIIGVTSIISGIIQLSKNSYSVWAYFDIIAGIAVAVIPLTTITCSVCNAPNPIHRIVKSVIQLERFACYECETEYKMSFWSRVLFLGITILWGGVLIALVWNFDVLVISVVWVYLLAFLLVLIRFSRYEALDKVSPDK